MRTHQVQMSEKQLDMKKATFHLSTWTLDNCPE